MANLWQETKARAEITQPESVFRARERAEQLGIKPQKVLGQNFVTDPNIISKIIGLARIEVTDVVLEIGPGLGALTQALVEKAKTVIAVEVDPRLALSVTAQVKPPPGHSLQVMNRDALKMAGADFRVDGIDPNLLVANLPYNIATPLILHLFEVLPSLQRYLVMVQSEVAQRWCATPGTKIYGVPSVKLAWFAEAKVVGKIDRAVFWPRPNVDSSLVELVRKPEPDTELSRSRIFKLIDSAFSQRRKTLLNALTSRGYLRERSSAAIAAMGLGEKVRGETLTCSQFIELGELLSSSVE